MTTEIVQKTPTNTLTEILATANTLAQTNTPTYRPDRFWSGMSGEPVTGAEVAHHLEATINILKRDGWVRRYSDDTEVDLSGDINTMSITTMIRKLFALAREEFGYSSDTRWTLSGAMNRAVNEDEGDDDTLYASARVLGVILRVSRGETTNKYDLIHDTWSAKIGRTEDEVMALLAAGAEFARQYGPTTAIA